MAASPSSTSLTFFLLRPSACPTSFSINSDFDINFATGCSPELDEGLRRDRVALCGRAPHVFRPWTFGSLRAKGVFHAVAHSQHVDALAVDRALVKEVFLAAVVPYEPESFVRPQRLNLS